MSAGAVGYPTCHHITSPWNEQSPLRQQAGKCFAAESRMPIAATIGVDAADLNSVERPTVTKATLRAWTGLSEVPFDRRGKRALLL